jgi:chromosome segregation ATPase
LSGHLVVRQDAADKAINELVVMLSSAEETIGNLHEFLEDNDDALQKCEAEVEKWKVIASLAERSCEVMEAELKQSESIISCTKREIEKIRRNCGRGVLGRVLGVRDKSIQ